MNAVIENRIVTEDPLLPLNQRSDEALLLTYRATGESELFETLVHRYERELFSYLRRYLGDAEMAEDCFQATFLQVHLKAEQFQQGRRFRPWLYTIATNQAIDARRRNKRHIAVSLDRAGGETEEVGKLIDLLVSDEPDPRVELDRAEQKRAVRRVVDEMPDAYRDAVMLVYYQGLKYREAAEILSIPVGTVKSRLHTALVKIDEAYRRPIAPQNSDHPDA
jgi:RNA polymerase sigma-70 factor (ECF subfamily)